MRRLAPDLPWVQGAAARLPRVQGALQGGEEAQVAHLHLVWLPYLNLHLHLHLPQVRRAGGAGAEAVEAAAGGAHLLTDLLSSVVHLL